jgi:hypothetical protein
MNKQFPRFKAVLMAAALTLISSIPALAEMPPPPVRLPPPPVSEPAEITMSQVEYQDVIYEYMDKGISMGRRQGFIIGGIAAIAAMAFGILLTLGKNRDLKKKDEEIERLQTVLTAKGLGRASVTYAVPPARFCATCGAAVKEGNAFCGECGAKTEYYTQ